MKAGRIHLDRRAFQSRVARRVFLAFGLSALLPVAAFAAFTLLRVGDELERGARDRLLAESKTVGMAVLDRLVAFELALQVVATSPDRDAALRMEQFRRIWRAPGSAAAPDASDPLSELRPRDASEWAHLESGRSLLRAVPTPGAGARLFLVRAAEDDVAAGLIVAELEPSHVWRPDALREDVEVLVRDEAGHPLFATAPGLARAEQADDRISIGGEPHLGASWSLFLDSMFGAGTWSIDHLQPDSAVFLPLKRFRAAFLPVALLAGGLALALGSRLIRRSLGPIDALRAATDAVARGDFERRVEIDTDDEFRDLGHAFNDMTGRVSDLTRNLEAKVKARTRELQRALDELRQTQAQLVHREKMASLGQFVAGIAHELNNPLAFVEGNIHFLRQYSEALVDALSAYEQEIGTDDGAVRSRLAKIREEHDIDRIVDDFEPVFEGCSEGIQRATTLVQDLRTFSRPDDDERVEADLNEAMDSTLNILRGRLDHVDLVREFGDLPPVECLSAQLNQVFLNLVANALDATEEGGRVTVRTRDLGNGEVAVEVEDDGCGMDEATRKRVFEPFFTTKDVGSGTGLGLSVSYGIVDRHDGRIEVESEIGRGTCFRVILPMHCVGANKATLDFEGQASEEWTA